MMNYTCIHKHAHIYTYVRTYILYCIVLYLSIYIASLAVHTNQRRSQCERPKEKKEVFRQRKEALGPPVNKQERVKGGSWFHSAGPMKAKACILAIAVLARGTKRSCRFSERIQWAKRSSRGRQPDKVT